jgi:uncharacterized protein (TIGR00255 family)
MTLQSMTGFARTQGAVDAGVATGKWTWELRSVNSKGLDIRLRLPLGFESVENACRKAISETLARGNIQASLQFTRDGSEPVPTINRAALEAVLQNLESLRARLGGAPPSAESIFLIKGVLEYGEAEASEEDIAIRNAAIVAGLVEALKELKSARLSEGTAIRCLLENQLAAINKLVMIVQSDPSRTPETIRERLETQLAPLLEDCSAIDPQRLHQEAAILATRADLREEIDRLSAHIDAGRNLIASGGPVGRKLDFLAQEFNRECNTICSKSNAASVTAAGLEMKLVIDQFREQIQNLE